MLKVVFLTDAFYKRYSDCYEIEQKDTRPYIRIEVELNGVTWAIPMRSNINHPHVIWTDKPNHCGIDFSKAVVVEKPNQYISSAKPHIRENEFKVLKQISEHRIKQRLEKYIRDYQKAKENPDIPRNERLLECSTLQYFEDYL
ncbi:MAG: hypothetical protein IJA49_01555 [Oscillospiraceae bacterium]|nr:hypothetical protein [Oscillospiraceae bacterium]